MTPNLKLFLKEAYNEEAYSIDFGSRKGDVGSKTTYDSRNGFNIVQYKMFLFA